MNSLNYFELKTILRVYKVPNTGNRAVLEQRVREVMEQHDVSIVEVVREVFSTERSREIVDSLVIEASEQDVGSMPVIDHEVHKLYPGVSIVKSVGDGAISMARDTEIRIENISQAVVGNFENRDVDQPRGWETEVENTDQPVPISVVKKVVSLPRDEEFRNDYVEPHDSASQVSHDSKTSGSSSASAMERRRMLRAEYAAAMLAGERQRELEEVKRRMSEQRREADRLQNEMNTRCSEGRDTAARRRGGHFNRPNS